MAIYFLGDFFIEFNKILREVYIMQIFSSLFFFKALKLPVFTHQVFFLLVCVTLSLNIYITSPFNELLNFLPL